MVVTNKGKNRLRDLLVNDISSGVHGTDGTDPTVSDTDLRAEDATTEANVVVTTGNKLMNSTHVLVSTIGDGTTYKEYGVKMNGDNDLLLLVVYPDFDKTLDVELHTINTIRFE